MVKIELELKESIDINTVHIASKMLTSDLLILKDAGSNKNIFVEDGKEYPRERELLL